MITKKHEFCFLYVKGQFVYIKPPRNSVKYIVDILWYFLHSHVLADTELLNRVFIKFVSYTYTIVLKSELASWISFI